MKIKTITFEIKQVITSLVVMSSENGYAMPTTPKELIDTVNEIKNNPSSVLSESESIESEVELLEYDIVEGEL